MQRWRILVKKKKKNEKEKKAYLYIFYTAFIGNAIELCIAKKKKKKFVNFFFLKKKVLLNSHRHHVALNRECVIKLPVQEAGALGGKPEERTAGCHIFLMPKKKRGGETGRRRRLEPRCGSRWHYTSQLCSLGPFCLKLNH